MEEQNYVAFESYLSEEMNAEERITFETQLQNDSEFQKAFNTYKELSNHLDSKFEHEADTVAFKQNLQNISDKHFGSATEEETIFLDESEAVIQKKSNVLKSKPFIFAIAASLLLLIGFTFFQQFSSPSFNDYSNYDRLSLTVRGDGDELVSNAENAFNDRNFADAATYFEALVKKVPANPEYQLFHAISLLELNFFDEADAIFSNIAEGESVYKYEAVWYQALSKLKQEDIEASVWLLESIPEDSDMYTRARKLLKKLD